MSGGAEIQAQCLTKLVDAYQQRFKPTLTRYIGVEPCKLFSKSCLQLTSSTAWLSDLEVQSSHFYAPCSLLRQRHCQAWLTTEPEDAQQVEIEGIDVE